MDPTKAHELHGQLRENSEELNDYKRDFNTWLKEIKKTDEDLSKKQHEVGNEEYPPIRNSTWVKQKRTENAKNVDELQNISNHNLNSKENSNQDDKLSDSESNTSTDSGDEQRIMMEKAEMEKERGNQFFKEGKYDEAIACYTKGIQCNSSNAILPANRAMALMKKGQFAAAEVDCTQSINRDPTYVKAFHRRGTCRFALKKYQLARQDFLKVSEMDPGNKLAKAELEKLEKIFQNKQPTKCPAVTPAKPEGSRTEKSDTCTTLVKAITKPPHLQSKKPLKRMQIELLNEEQDRKEVPVKKLTEEMPKVVPKPIKTVETPVKELITSPIAAPSLPPIPHSAFQFLTNWKKLHNFPDLQLQYIQQLPPTELPQIFKEAMESEILSDILNVLQKNVTEFSNESILYILQNIPKVGRFKTLVMFLSDEEKKVIKSLVERASNANREDASELLRLYKIA